MLSYNGVFWLIIGGVFCFVEDYKGKGVKFKKLKSKKFK